jgi:hypothetical protein
MDPALIYGQYGAIVCLVIAVVHLYRENTALRQDAMNLLKKYQDRDEEERKLRQEEAAEERRRERERTTPR